MNCRGCNTRVPAGAKSCPHCGAEVRNEGVYARSSGPTVLPAPGLSSARDADEEYVELDEMTEETPVQKTAAPAARKRSTNREPAPARSGGEPPLFAPDAGGLRALLAEQPEVLERGLEVYCDSEGTPLGAGYASGVGDIDLLARSADGELVVVMVSERGDDGEALVAEVLQRIGWVRKHVAAGKSRVRGIVLCEEAPESLIYSAAAVADTVQFKTYRVALTFEDLDV